MDQKRNFRVKKSDILTLISFAVAVRAAVSLYPYSGKNKPPIYGDYEAQRHWQEITVNLAPKDWYTNSSANNLLYWGLDYPPLTAYHSYIVGKIAQLVEPKFVELHKSRGIETKKHATFMRLTVLTADVIVFIPAIFLLGLALDNAFNKNVLIAYIALMTNYPGQILIDNGHFQYNNISLGLAALAIACLLTNRDYLAAFVFTLALNYKQMELYHALPIFFYLLHQCVFVPKTSKQRFQKFFYIAGLVTVTFSALWYPWMNNLSSVMTVIKRLFPIYRGVFEDKVASFWCALNVIYKIKYKFSNEQMSLICLFTTAVAALPINFALFLSKSKQKVIYALTNTALSFFLFSFQVHEKSILLVVLPCSCLLVLKPAMTYHILQCAIISMLPLFIKDQLTIPYFATSTIFLITIKMCQKNVMECRLMNKYYVLSTFIFFVISLTVCTAPVPYRYPYFWSLGTSLYSFLNLAFCLLLGTYFQLS